MNALQFQKKLLSIQENMMNFALLLTSNQTDAEDLMQDTSLKVLDNKDKFIDNANFKGWVLTVMRNIFINNYHRIIRTQVMIDQIPDFEGLDIVDEFGLERSEYFFQLNELSDAINKLNDDLKIPLSMHLSGYKYAEIAKSLEIPLGTVKSRIFFARRELQKTLNDLSL
ncbi:MAG: RNA polymerase sigma factor [Tannerellaceae bacterium]|jgi:RNA polymerase sigma-70 factor (ECF subfamily)|nr:RNA polymerase sigma factor [Tannerellaceae bacterium]